MNVVVLSLVGRLRDQLLARGQRIAFAESCTGGLLAKYVTDASGSSAWFECGLVTYSNRSKVELLGVPCQILETSGAVSRQCAEAMALGVLEKTVATWSVAVTGIAGPDGGSLDKPVGTVWIAWAERASTTSSAEYRFEGDRDAVREQTAIAALTGLLQRLEDGRQ